MASDAFYMLLHVFIKAASSCKNNVLVGTEACSDARLNLVSLSTDTYRNTGTKSPPWCSSECLLDVMCRFAVAVGGCVAALTAGISCVSLPNPNWRPVTEAA
jgi:hypothetical protein